MLYDLFAVSNHMGSMGYGHYTAFAMNFRDKQWYCYDDPNVRRIGEKEVVTENAYLLLY